MTGRGRIRALVVGALLVGAPLWLACAESESDTGGGVGASSATDASTGGSGGSGSPTGGSAGSSTGGSGAGATGGSGGASGSAGSGGVVGGAGGSVGGSGGSVGGSGGGTGGSTTCPTGNGAAMVEVLGVCIDSTEVTNAHYAAFLAAGVPPQSTSGSPAACSWNTTYTPSSGWPAVGKDDYPVVYVDWCDAYAYCQWAGKRLCGRVGGGANAYDDYDQPGLSQWLRACSAGGQNIYPYGNSYVANACNGIDYGAGASIPVKQASGCQGPPGIFDLSGNVWEWEDSCQASTGSTDQCRLRGGSFWYGGATALACASGNVNDRGAKNDIYGFRCCAP
jgi:hypothetical protein